VSEQDERLIQCPDDPGLHYYVWACVDKARRFERCARCEALRKALEDGTTEQETQADEG